MSPITVQAVIDRVGRERGLSLDFRLVNDSDTLWLEVEGFRVRLAGPYAEASNEEDLYELLDGWVAYNRPGGPGRWLDRDDRMLQERTQAIAVDEPHWYAANSDVWRDVLTTTSREYRWSLERVPVDTASGLPVRKSDQRVVAPAVRPDKLRLSLTITSSAGSVEELLPELGDTPAYAWEVIASMATSRLAEDSWLLWPRCPSDDSLLHMKQSGDVARWSCRHNDFSANAGALPAI